MACIPKHLFVSTGALILAATTAQSVIPGKGFNVHKTPQPPADQQQLDVPPPRPATPFDGQLVLTPEARRRISIFGAKAITTHC